MLEKQVAAKPVVNLEPQDVEKSLKMLGFNPSSLCGTLFKSGDTVFRCRDCGTDDNRVLCEKCFTNSHHKTHNFTLTINTRELGGFCDCGDSSSFPTNATCQLHQSLATTSEDDD